MFDSIFELTIVALRKQRDDYVGPRRSTCATGPTGHTLTNPKLRASIRPTLWTPPKLHLATNERGRCGKTEGRPRPRGRRSCYRGHPPIHPPRCAIKSRSPLAVCSIADAVNGAGCPVKSMPPRKIRRASHGRAAVCAQRRCLLTVAHQLVHLGTSDTLEAAN
jgi:hypothetical protein